MIVACGIQIEAIDKNMAVLPGSSWPRCLRLRLSRCDLPNPASECILQCWAPDWDSGVLALTEPNEIDLPDVLNGALIEVRSYDRYTHELFASERTRVAFIAELPLRAIMQPAHRVKTVVDVGPVDVSRSPLPVSGKMLVGRVVVLLGVLLIAGRYFTREEIKPPLVAAPGTSINAPSSAAPLGPAAAPVAASNYAVLAAKARLHGTPALGSSNVVGEYVLGTRFSGRAAAEGFVEAHMDNGVRGFFDSRVVGDAARVERLIREPAQTLANLEVLRPSPINEVALRYLEQIQSVTLFDSDATARAFGQASRDAFARVVSDDVTARYFYYLGLVASDSARIGEAERYFSAAVRANPLDERAVQQLALFQGAHKNHVNPLLAAHAVLLNSDSATAWILVALSLPEHETLRIIKVLKQAITASSGRNASQDPITTRQFLQQLKETRATSGLTRAIDAVLADRMLW